MILNEFTSFFDNLEVIPKIKHIWSKFQLSTYENDSIIFESVCHKISRKTSKLKPIIIQLGQEHLYLFKNKNPHGMLLLTVVVMTIQKNENGVMIRLLRNGYRKTIYILIKQFQSQSLLFLDYQKGIFIYQFIIMMRDECLIYFRINKKKRGKELNFVSETTIYQNDQRKNILINQRFYESKIRKQILESKKLLKIRKILSFKKNITVLQKCFKYK